jgi:hypothetical protein
LRDTLFDAVGSVPERRRHGEARERALGAPSAPELQVGDLEIAVVGLDQQVTVAAVDLPAQIAGARTAAAIGQRGNDATGEPCRHRRMVRCGHWAGNAIDRDGRPPDAGDRGYRFELAEQVGHRVHGMQQRHRHGARAGCRVEHVGVIGITCVSPGHARAAESGGERASDGALREERGGVAEHRGIARLQPDRGAKAAARRLRGEAFGLGEVASERPLAQHRAAGVQRGGDQGLMRRDLDRHDHQFDVVLPQQPFDAAVARHAEGLAGRLRRLNLARRHGAKF